MTEWKTYRLGDIIDKIIDNRGKSAPTSDEKYSPIIEINSIGDRNPNYDVVRKWVSKDTYDTWFRSGHPMIGDILIPTVGTIGIVSMMRENKGCIAQNIVALRTNEKAHNLYLYYFLKSGYVKQELLNLNIGGVQPSIKVPHLLNLDILLPSLEEQRRIAGILGAIDDKIENNRRINDNLEQQAQALFEEWCESCSKTITIKELADNILDYTPNANSKVVLLNSSDVTQGLFAELPLVDNVNLKGQFKKRFQKDDILYSEIRPRNKHYAYCYFDSDRYIASTRLIVLRGKKEKIVSNTLLYQYLISQTVFEEFTLKTETRSGTFPQGNYQDLSSIVVPYSDNQKEIAGSLDVIYEEIWSNYKENETLATLRDTLLPKLMNGEIKIK